MVKEIEKDNWNSNTTPLQILLEILYVFKKPDDSKNYFPGNQGNEAALQLYRSNPDKYNTNQYRSV